MNRFVTGGSWGVPQAAAGSDCKNSFWVQNLLVFHPDTGLMQFPCPAGFLSYGNEKELR
jgi:hypothetical protein